MSEESSNQNSEIQSRINEMIHQAQDKVNDLISQIEELSIDVSKEISVDSKSDEVVMRVGVTRFDRKLSTSATFQQLEEIVRPSFPKDQPYFGYKDDNMQFIWLRNTRDLHYLFKEFHAGSSKFIHIISIRKNVIGPVAQIDFSNEDQTEENRIPIKYGPFGQDYPHIFISISKTESFQNGIEYIKSFNPKAKFLTYIDSEGDSFNLEGNVEWEYFLTEATTGGNSGHFATVFATE